MKHNWEKKKLGDIGTLTSSKRIYKKEYVTNGVPFYRSKEIKELAHNKDISLDLYISNERYEEIKEKFGVPEEGDILLTAVGTIGEMYVVKDNETFYFKDGNIMWLKGFSSLNSYYLKYALTFFVEKLKAMSRGAAYSALTIEKLKEYSVSFPSLSEQQRIVTILDKTFTSIDKAKAHAEQNLKNSKELFESYLQEVFENKGKDWEEKKLGDIGTLTSSKRIYKKEYVTNGVPFYRSKEIKELAHNKDISLDLYISNERYEEIKEKFGVPEEGDILLTAVGTIGEMYVVKDNETFYFKDGNIMWLKGFSSLNSYYLKYALTFFVEKLKAMSRGAAYGALTIEKLKEYSVPIPTINKQQTIVQQLDTISEEIKKLGAIYQKKIDGLDELKKSILQKAFNGELKTEKELAL